MRRRNCAPHMPGTSTVHRQDPNGERGAQHQHGVVTMSAEYFTSGTFKGVPVTDAFAAAALQQEAVVVKLGPIPWPSGLAPSPTALGTHKPGAVEEVLQRLLDVARPPDIGRRVEQADQRLQVEAIGFVGHRASPVRGRSSCDYSQREARREVYLR